MPAMISGRFCGSCAYWSGERGLCQGGRKVQCNSFSDKGQCLCPRMSKSVQHQANQPGCPKYTQWSEIRQAQKETTGGRESDGSAACCFA